MFAEKAEARTQWLLAFPAVLASAVAESRIDDHMISNRQIADLRPRRFHHSGRICTENPRRSDRNTRKTGDDKEIEAVERDGADANAHVARPLQLGHREISAVLDAIEPAVTGDRECLHEKTANALILAVREVSVNGGKAEQTLSQSV